MVFWNQPNHAESEDTKLVHLIPAQGSVLSPREFVVCYSANLTGAELDVLRVAVNILGTDAAIPAPLRRPWIAAQIGAEEKLDCIAVRASGARSVLWQTEHIQFKGCRPADSSKNFPFEFLAFGSDTITSTRIPFGIMTAEGVMRELLGYCFCKAHGIPCSTSPVCVYTYSTGPANGQFCLVLRTAGCPRAEGFLQLKRLPVSELVSSAASSKVLTGSEICMQGLNSGWYADQKGRWLTELHFRGGFRGLLNNNIGNDVIESLSDGKKRFLFCDFDSFRLIPVLATPSREFMEAFALQCVVEVVKGSLPILHYVSVSHDADTRQVAGRVGEAYRQRSSLWNSYIRHARLKVRELGWSQAEFETAIQHAFTAPAFLQASCSVVLSDFALKLYRERKPQPNVPH